MTGPHLNRKLVLEDSYRVPDTAGGSTTQWQALGTVWADIAPATGRDRFAGEIQQSRVPLRIIVRAAPVGSPARPRAGQRFTEGSRVYAILSVTEQRSLARFLVCQAREEVAT